MVGEDYDSGPYSVTFVTEETSASFDVPITDDDILENDENFKLSINSTSLPKDVTVGDPSDISVTILDNDGK